jgi:hypothetical protein
MVQEQQRIERLVLRGCANASLRRQTGKKLGDLRLCHFQWMAFVVKEYVSLNPMDIRLFGSIAIVPSPDRLADLIEQFWLWRRCWRIDLRRCPQIDFCSVVIL